MKTSKIIWLSVLAGILILLSVFKVSNNDYKKPVGQSAVLSQELLSNSKKAKESLIFNNYTQAKQQTNILNNATTNFNSLRLSNTSETLDKLLTKDSSILLKNAFIDTDLPLELKIPEHLKSDSDPGAYIIQFKPGKNNEINSQLAKAGLKVISYIPNNSYLVTGSLQALDRLNEIAGLKTILPYEPYYKIDNRLLKSAIENKIISDSILRVSLFPNSEASERLKELGVELIATGHGVFGPEFIVKPGNVTLAQIAKLKEVQLIEPYYKKSLANDLSRVRLGVVDTVEQSTNYLGLTGSNMWVNINDNDIDSTHPALSGRIFIGNTNIVQDTNGHGTHIAGVIAGDGSKSDTVVFAPGSGAGSSNLFRGLAPESRILFQYVNFDSFSTDDLLLVETAASTNYITLNRTNILISNNSWNYTGNHEYDSSAALFDAATRDAIVGIPGSQPVLFVFSAGNSGGGDDNGLGGESGTIESPATAKNIITVGAIESPRNITNEVAVIDDWGNVSTNTAFLWQSDSDNEVAAYSSRGNVGIGQEGEYGRFKPDVVAPGSFIISTRAHQYHIDPNKTYKRRNYLRDLVLKAKSKNQYSVFVPTNAVSLKIYIMPNRESPKPFPGIPIYVRYGELPGSEDFVNTNNIVSIPPDKSIKSGNWYYLLEWNGDLDIKFDIVTELELRPPNNGYYEALKNIDDELGDYYCYLSGTSVAAGKISGLLALIQEFLITKADINPSPALLKAILINGARSVNSIYSLSPFSTVNYQGWGIPLLYYCLPPAVTNSDNKLWPVIFFDQSPSNALATGQSFTKKIKLSKSVRNYPLRLTLVWTDPPANPAAAIKLVNDLDLIVYTSKTNNTEGTNSVSQTNNVYYGNNIPAESDFTVPADDTTQPDSINNVENVIIQPPLEEEYTIRVYARRVNVNAVTAHTNDIVQDFALVVSCGDPSIVYTNTAEPIIKVESVTNVVERPPLTIITNGIPLLHEHIGANSPLIGSYLGQTNQWRFYVFTNTFMTNSLLSLTNGSNVAFITFIPPNLSRPRNREADIDLYVSTNSAITNLDPLVIAAADKSTNRGGTEVVVYTNAPLDQVYYVGVKCEDQQGAEYGFVGLSSNRPFDEEVNGNRVLHGLPVPVDIPDGTPDKAGAVNVFAISVVPVNVLRVVVTNVIAHQLIGDLVGIISHEGVSAVLNNHTLNGQNYSGTNVFIYDDTQRGDILGSRLSDGPGSLMDFIGMRSAGLWLLTMIDNSLNQTGSVHGFEVMVEPAYDSLSGSISPNSYEYYYVDVPGDAIKLKIILQDINPLLPLELYAMRGKIPSTERYDKYAIIDPPSGMLTIGTNDVPPLAMGRYYIAVYNPNQAVVNYRISADITRSFNTFSAGSFFSFDTPIQILDDAVTKSTIFVPDDRIITEVRVGVRIDHPRVSDLALRLTAPSGKSVLLFENRGFWDTNGLGSGSLSNMNLVYAGFAENDDIAPGLIKFAQPPFSTNIGAGVANIISDFEGLAAGQYTNIVDGWAVDGVVEIISATNNVQTGTNVLSMLSGKISQVIPTTFGRQYILAFDYFTGSTSVITNLQPPYIYHPKVTTNGLEITWNSTKDVEYQIEVSTNLVSWSVLGTVIGNGSEMTYIDTTSNISSGGLYYRIIILNVPQPPENPEQITVSLSDVTIGTNGVTITWNSIADGVYEIQSSADLSKWDKLAEVTAITNSTSYVDTNAFSDGVLKFYRVLFVSGPTTGKPVELKISVDGREAGIITNLYQQWRTYYLPFTPEASGTLVELDASNNRGIVYVDNLRLIESGATIYYKPEESLSYFVGDNSYGEWTLEILDSRVGATNPTPQLLSWHLEIGYVMTNYPAVTLTPGVPYQGTVEGDQIRYFIVNTPRAARHATNIVFSDGDVILLANRDGLPSGDPLKDDFYVNNNGPGGGEYLLMTVDDPVKPLIPGQRYYLGVKNANTNETNTFIIFVDFDKLDTNEPPIIELTNGVVVTNILKPGNIYHYYKFQVSTQATWASFYILNPSGDVNLYMKKDMPLPDKKNSIYASENSGNSYEEILLFTNSVPVPLTPGTWYLTVVNNDTNSVEYNIVAQEYSGEIPTPITLTNNVPYTNTIAAGFQYYEFSITEEATWASFEVVKMSSDVDLYMALMPKLPTLFLYDFASTNSGTNDELILLFTNSTPVKLTAGDWYLGVYLKTNAMANYTIIARQYTSAPPALITLTNNVAYNSTNINPGEIQYYLFNVSNSSTQAIFEVYDNDIDVDLFIKKGLPLPDSTNYYYASTNSGTNSELLIINKNSSPVPLSQGIWFASVINMGNTSGTYKIKAREISSAGPVNWTNIAAEVIYTNGMICIVWESTPGYYYRIEGKVNLEDSGWNLIEDNIVASDTITRYCIPITNPNRFFRVLVRSGGIIIPPEVTNIVIYPTTYSVSNLLCLTWQTYPGATYGLDGKASLDDNEWTRITNIVATATNTTICLPLNNTNRFFRVVLLNYETGGGTPSVVTNLNVKIEFNYFQNKIVLSWSNSPGLHYDIEMKDFLESSNWVVVRSNLESTADQNIIDLPFTNNAGFFRICIKP